MNINLNREILTYNRTIKHLINNAYEGFKTKYPTEEPFWRVSCFRKRKKEDRRIALKDLDKGVSSLWSTKDEMGNVTPEEKKMKPSVVYKETQVKKYKIKETKNPQKGTIKTHVESKYEYETTTTDDVLMDLNIDDVEVCCDYGEPKSMDVFVLNHQTTQIDSYEVHGLMGTCISEKRINKGSSVEDFIVSLNNLIDESNMIKDENTKRMTALNEECNVFKTKLKEIMTTGTIDKVAEEMKIKERDKMRLMNCLGSKKSISQVLIEHLFLKEKIDKLTSTVLNLSIRFPTYDYKEIIRKDKIEGIFKFIHFMTNWIQKKFYEDNFYDELIKENTKSGKDENEELERFLYTN